MSSVTPEHREPGKDEIEDSIPSQWQTLLRFGSRRAVPVVLQTETAECGLACIAMVAGFHGAKHDLPSLRSKFPGSLRGLKLSEMVDISAALGLAARPVKLELEDISHLELPCILHWNMRHFVVLEGRSGKALDIIDPAFGRRRASIAEADASFTGIAVEFSVGPNLVKPEKPRSVSLTSLAGGISGLGKGLLQVAAIAVFLELLGLLAPQFLQLVLDQVLSAHDGELLTLLGVGFSALLLLRIAAEYVRSWLVIWLGAALSIGWTGNVFNHLLHLPLDYFQKRNLGDVVSRFGSINTIQQTLTTQFVVVIIDGVMALLTAVMLLTYSVKLALIAFVGAGIYSVARVIYFRVVLESTAKNINVIAAQHGALIETLRGVQTIRLQNKTAERSMRFANATADVTNTGTRLQRLSIGFSSASGLISGAQRVAVLWVGASFVLGGQLTAGMLMAFAAYSEQFTTRFSAMVDYLVQLRMLRLHGERLADIVLTGPEKYVERTHVGTLQDTSIRFESVSFRYSSNTQMVLNDCSFAVDEGEVVAIVGPSGCGKSTLAKLLLGVLDHQAGTISIGGVSIRSLGKREVREIVASVLQDDYVFSGTVMDNISFFDPAATLERCREAARMASIEAEIEMMPMGYQSMIGDMGATLSGGQLQRILLARAFYRKPKILVLDEATSSLDVDNEARICEAVRRAGVTAIVIAHRPQTIASADRAVSLANGQISEMRIRQEMLA